MSAYLRANKNCMMFDADRREVLCVGWNKPRQQNSLGVGWLGNSSVTRALEVLVGSDEHKPAADPDGERH